MVWGVGTRPTLSLLNPKKVPLNQDNTVSCFEHAQRCVGTWSFLKSTPCVFFLSFRKVSDSQSCGRMLHCYR